MTCFNFISSPSNVQYLIIIKHYYRFFPGVIILKHWLSFPPWIVIYTEVLQICMMPPPPKKVCALLKQIPWKFFKIFKQREILQGLWIKRRFSEKIVFQKIKRRYQSHPYFHMEKYYQNNSGTKWQQNEIKIESSTYIVCTNDINNAFKAFQ